MLLIIEALFFVTGLWAIISGDNLVYHRWRTLDRKFLGRHIPIHSYDCDYWN
jgi:hypothetical protein